MGDVVRATFWRHNGRKATPSIFVGIDPGANGSVVVIDIGGCLWGVVRLAGDDDAARDEQARKVAGVFRAIKQASEPCVACIETTFAPRRAKGYAAMRLGESRGILIGLAIGCGLPPLCEVAASVWQRDLGVLTGGKKKVTRDRAAELFPEHPHVTNADADGLLIAEWTRQQFAPVETWRR